MRLVAPPRCRVVAIRQLLYRRAVSRTQTTAAGFADSKGLPAPPARPAGGTTLNPDTTLKPFTAEPAPPRQVRAEKPKWWLAVVAGAVLRAMGLVSSRSASFLDFLAKGQLPPGRVGLTAFQEALVIDGAQGCRCYLIVDITAIVIVIIIVIVVVIVMGIVVDANIRMGG